MAVEAGAGASIEVGVLAGVLNLEVTVLCEVQVAGLDTSNIVRLEVLRTLLLVPVAYVGGTRKVCERCGHVTVKVLDRLGGNVH